MNASTLNVRSPGTRYRPPACRSEAAWCESRATPGRFATRWRAFAAALLVALSIPAVAATAPTLAGFPAEVALPRVSADGIFDPSLAQEPGSAQIYMAYTAINPSPTWPTRNPDVTSTRLAVSSDGGATWIDQGPIASSVDVQLPGGAAGHAATWVVEVPNLVFDPGAPARERWKLLTLHYLVVDGVSHWEDLWIGLRMARQPSGLATAREVKLFTGAYYNGANVATNADTGTVRAPLGESPAIALDTQFGPDLGGCIFAEPGMAATPSALYLALVCNRSASDRQIALFRCASPCDPVSASSWTYLGSTLGTADAARFGFDEGFSAPDLYVANGRFYVIVTPQSSTPWEGHYDGCMVFAFDDVDAARIARTPDGAPQYVARINGAPGSFNGACTFMPGAAGSGVLYSELDVANDPPFKVLMSGVML